MNSFGTTRAFAGMGRPPAGLGSPDQKVRVMIVMDVESESPEFSKIDVNLAGPEWKISGRVRFTVKGYAHDEGFVSVQHALDGEESDIRIGAMPFVIDVAFDNAATKSEALNKAALQLKTIAAEFAKLAETVLAGSANSGKH